MYITSSFKNIYSWDFSTRNTVKNTVICTIREPPDVTITNPVNLYSTTKRQVPLRNIKETTTDRLIKPTSYTTSKTLLGRRRIITPQQRSSTPRNSPIVVDDRPCKVIAMIDIKQKTECLATATQKRKSL